MLRCVTVIVQNDKTVSVGKDCQLKTLRIGKVKAQHAHSACTSAAAPGPTPGTLEEAMRDPAQGAASQAPSNPPELS